MITITNIGPHNNPFGECKYVIRINSEFVCEFKHNRSEGLAKCLMEASKAVYRKEIENTTEVIVDENYFALKEKPGRTFKC